MLVIKIDSDEVMSIWDLQARYNLQHRLTIIRAVDTTPIASINRTNSRERKSENDLHQLTAQNHRRSTCRELSYQPYMSRSCIERSALLRNRQTDSVNTCAIHEMENRYIRAQLFGGMIALLHRQQRIGSVREAWIATWTAPNKTLMAPSTAIDSIDVLRDYDRQTGFAEGFLWCTLTRVDSHFSPGVASFWIGRAHRICYIFALVAVCVREP